MVRWLMAALLGTLLFPCSKLRAQSEATVGPSPSAHEMEVWLSETHALPFLSPGRGHAEFLEIGALYGWVLTPQVGPGPLRGNFEYAVEIIPVIVPFQSSGATYGAGATPIVLKWNFQQHRNFLLYAEGYGGGMRTVNPVPVNGTHLNFVTGGAMGIEILRDGRAWSVDFRFHHISDAHLLPTDPTYNALELRVGLGIFRHRKSF